MASSHRIAVLVTALILSALMSAATLALALFVEYLASSTTHRIGVDDLQTTLYVSAVAAFVTVPAAIAAGLPAYLLLERLGILNWWSVSVIGAIAGLMVKNIVSIPELSYGSTAALGALTAFIALRLLKAELSIRGRQKIKRDEAAPPTSAP